MRAWSCGCIHPDSRPPLLADVDGVKNAILVEVTRSAPRLYYGAGAGGAPTASAVVADLVDLAVTWAWAIPCRVPPLGFARADLRELPIVPMERVVTLPGIPRMEVEDKPGVLSKWRAYSASRASVSGLIQKAPAEGQTRVQLIVVTNKAVQGSMDKAVTAIEALDTIAGKGHPYSGGSAGRLTIRKCKREIHQHPGQAPTRFRTGSPHWPGLGRRPVRARGIAKFQSR